MTEVTVLLNVPTPLGRDLVIASNGVAIVTARFVARRARNVWSRDPLLREAAAQIRAYFRRRLARFDLPLQPEGTAFARAVYALAADLEFGEFVSYADLARAAGRPLAHRGVALAMRRTPIDLLIPAHRVLGSDGRVRGAKRGSLRLRLVAFERATKRRQAARDGE